MDARPMQDPNQTTERADIASRRRVATPATVRLRTPVRGRSSAAGFLPVSGPADHEHGTGRVMHQIVAH